MELCGTFRSLGDLILMATISGPAYRTRSSATTRKSIAGREATTSTSKPGVSTRPSTTTSSGRSATTRGSLSRQSLTGHQATAAVPDLNDRFKQLEERLIKLENDNTTLRALVGQLQDRVSTQDSVIEKLARAEEAARENISLGQLELNTNIVLRGIEVSEDTTEESLSAVYSGIRKHLQIESEPDFDPVAISVIPSKRKEAKRPCAPIRIAFKSVAAKRNFLQIRRIKKDIFPREIEVEQNSQRPILITEELTYSNQQLLYQARSLRGKNRYQFVWSNNGQVLARRSTRARVIRIIDTEHINRLRAQLNIPPLQDNGTRFSTTLDRDGLSDP